MPPAPGLLSLYRIPTMCMSASFFTLVLFQIFSRQITPCSLPPCVWLELRLSYLEALAIDTGCL